MLPGSLPVHPSIATMLRWQVLPVLWLLIAAAGCAGPGPKSFPPAAVQERFEADGSGECWYDVDGNGRKDYGEVYAAGRLTAIRYDRDEDGQTDETVVLADVPAGERRYLVMLLDSVRFDIVENLWQRGRFRYCGRPTRVVSTFPAMTDLSFAEFFGASPCPGIESEFYDGHKLNDGYWVYLHEGNANWAAHTDYHLPQCYHGSAYTDIHAWFGHELRRIEELFLHSDRRLFVSYSVGSSALGAEEGFNGHETAMVNVDRLCRGLIYRTRGRVRFALLSDHGLFITPEESRLVSIREGLANYGYHVTERLRRTGDVVVPEFEMISTSSIWTQTPGPVARDALGIKGVEMAAYAEGDGLVVLNKTGRATIQKSAQGFRYVPQSGDPLELQPILEVLKTEGQVDASGFVNDRALFEATLHHTFPDPLARLWRGFHGLVRHTPDVILALEEGYHTGSPLQTALINMVGVHGNLRQISSNGFALTTEGELPADIRMEDLRAALQAQGVPFELSR